MIDCIEADEHVFYVSVDLATRRNPLTFHTYDELASGDRVLICGGVLEGSEGTVVDVGVDPVVKRWKSGVLSDVPIYTYRCEAVAAPRVIAVETVRTWSDGSVTHETVWSED